MTSRLPPRSTVAEPRGRRGPGPFALRIGPACVALAGTRLEPAHFPLGPGHPGFLDPSARPDLTLRVLLGPAGRPPARLMFRAGDVLSVYRAGGVWSFRVGPEDGGLPADRALEFAGSAGTLRLDTARSPDLAAGYPLEYPLEEFLFRHLLAHRGAVIVHACGVSWRRRGYLFVGSSGAGKSTTARLWRSAGGTILNDDRVVLDRSAASPLLHPTPWFGEHPELGGEAVPLSAIYVLRHGAEPAFAPLRPAEAAALLFAKSFPPLWDPDGIAAVLSALDATVQRVPCGWLTVPPDRRAVEWVQAQA